MDAPKNIKYRLSPKLVASEVSDETVILDYEAGKYFGLEGVGSFVWSVLQKDAPLSINDLSKRVTEAYEVDENQCIADLEALIDNLKKNGLIEASS